MKRTISLFAALTVVFVILATGHAFAQEKTSVKVKSSEVVTCTSTSQKQTARLEGNGGTNRTCGGK